MLLKNSLVNSIVAPALIMLARDDYNYYFREDCRRGYEDGFNNSYRYGRFVDDTPSILEIILSQILNFQ